jgi:ferrous iron transport protein A
MSQERSKLLKLSKSRAGQAGVLNSFSGDDEMKRRFREMGFFEGAEITVKSRMPFGGPLVIEIDDFTIAIRQSEAEFILMELA